jgi:hypothetical protein
MDAYFSQNKINKKWAKALCSQVLGAPLKYRAIEVWRLPRNHFIDREYLHHLQLLDQLLGKPFSMEFMYGGWKQLRHDDISWLPAIGEPWEPCPQV